MYTLCRLAVVTLHMDATGQPTINQCRKAMHKRATKAITSHFHHFSRSLPSIAFGHTRKESERQSKATTAEKATQWRKARKNGVERSGIYWSEEKTIKIIGILCRFPTTKNRKGSENEFLGIKWEENHLNFNPIFFVQNVSNQIISVPITQKA